MLFPSKRHEMEHQKFSDVFKERVTKIEEEAKAIGLNFTTICKEAGISRATPDRWKRATPKTVALVDRMEGIVERHKKEHAAAGR